MHFGCGNPPLCSGVIAVPSGPKSHTLTVILAVFAPQPSWRHKPWKGLFKIQMFPRICLSLVSSPFNRTIEGLADLLFLNLRIFWVFVWVFERWLHQVFTIWALSFVVTDLEYREYYCNAILGDEDGLILFVTRHKISRFLVILPNG